MASNDRARSDPAADPNWSLAEAMQTTDTGIKTHRDDLVIDFDSVALLERIREFLDPERSLSEVRAKFFGTKAFGKYKPGDNRSWTMSGARRAFKNLNAPLETFVRELDYRPFDCRFIFYNAALIDFAREDLMRHMEGGRNIGLIATRRVPNGAFCHVFVTRRLIEVKTGSDDRDTNLFPLYVDGGTASLNFGDGPRPNYSAKFLEELSLALGLRRTGIDGLPTGLAPEDIFHYVYAVFHSPGYRSRYAESLKIDFPRLPLTENLELFRALARLGGELVALHLLESPKLAQPITEFFVGTLLPVVKKVWWTKKDIGFKPRAIREVGRVMIGSAEAGFYGVPEDVWNFQIGGYQVCEKWLKDRTGRTLSSDDAAHYQKIVVALSETIRLMKEIDGVIEQHGGWPVAFQARQAKQQQRPR